MIFDVSAFFFFRFTTMNLHLFNDERKKKNKEKYKPYSVCDFHHDGSKWGLGPGSSVGHAEVCPEGAVPSRQ